jgi:pyrroloquinoline quinone biosynthesis protein D
MTVHLGMTLPSIPSAARPRISSRARLQTDKITGKPVLLYPEGILVLNPTGHAIVSLCTGTATVQEIVADLAGRYRVTTEQIAPDVTDYLNRLRERNLLELLDGPTPS